MLSTWSSTLMPSFVRPMRGNDSSASGMSSGTGPVRASASSAVACSFAWAAIRCCCSMTLSRSGCPLDAEMQLLGRPLFELLPLQPADIGLGEGERQRDRLGIVAGVVDRRRGRFGVVRDLPELRAVRETVDARPQPLVPEDLADRATAVVVGLDGVATEPAVVFLALRRQQHRGGDFAAVVELDEIGAEQHAGLEPLLGRPLGRGLRHALLHQLVGVLLDRLGAQLLRRPAPGWRAPPRCSCPRAARSSSESTTEAATSQGPSSSNIAEASGALASPAPRSATT